MVFDAGVLIAHLSRTDAFHDAVQRFLEENEEFEFAANALTMAECLVHPTAAGRATTALGVFERLMLQQLAVTADDAAGIAEVRAATRLRMPDAIVLYTAERHGAELVTTDRVLARAATERSVPATLLRP
jgi:predicted nucleic acid-binding protein